MRASSRLAALLLPALLLPACIEADVRTEVREDGSGSLGMNMKFTDRFVEIVRKLEKVDAKSDLVKKTREGMMQKPDDTALAELEKAGLKLSEFECVADEKRISAKVRVEFRSLAALRGMKKFGGSAQEEMPMGGFTLTRDDKGIYTLAMAGAEDEEEAAAAIGEALEPKKEGGDAKEAEAGAREPEKKDPEAEKKAMEESMAAMGELFAELQNLKFTISMKVPGEVVDFAPALAAKKDGGTVTWEFTAQTMMELQMSGGMEEEENPMDSFKIRFRMPEGKSIPDSCLTPAAAPKEKTATPAPAPAPEKPAEPK